MLKTIFCISGTRADYGKLKSILKKLDNHPNFNLILFVTGMHLLEKYGMTVIEIERDGYENIIKISNQQEINEMDVTLANTITLLGPYIKTHHPDLVLVHGDRLEALAGAISGAFNNIKVAHIEGGEVSGTIDESIRHAITKLSHYHFVANKSAASRVVQLGEPGESIFVIGSPDIDVMMSSSLPSLEEAKRHYEIPFDEFAILLYHPVTTEVDRLASDVRVIVDAVLETEINYIVIYPNNDHGNEIILNEYSRFDDRDNIKMFPSIRFEYFLTFIRHSMFMMGNSSAGVRETTIYGTPSINIGKRQDGRYDEKSNSTIVSVCENKADILEGIMNVTKRKRTDGYSDFGNGESADRFIDILSKDEFWKKDIQKKFVDIGND